MQPNQYPGQYPNPYPGQYPPGQYPGQYPPPPPKSSTPTALIVLLLMVPVGVIVLGCLAAIAIPAFTRYVKRSKTSEATGNITTISTGVRSYYARMSSSVLPGQRAAPATLLPPSTGLTPAAIPAAQRVMDPPGTWETPAWQAIGFSMSSPHYYSYEFQNLGDGRFVIRAYGNLDGDGINSTFERAGRVSASGEIEVDGFNITNELE